MTSPPTPTPPALRGRALVDLQADLQRAGFPAWRAKQVFHWVFRHAARSLDEMTNLPADLRAWLAANTRWGGIREAASMRRSPDGAVKFLFALEDGQAVESVLMPAEDHYTLCVSSQVGCPLRCAFCVTGLVGLRRNLTADEIVDQALFARRFLKEEAAAGRLPSPAAPPAEAPLRNLVFMGMGEPLLNAPAVIEALRLLLRPDGPDFSPRRITVSTVGILPGIESLAASDLDVKLAISLNATTEETRRRLMPITRKYPLSAVLEACRRFPLRKRQRITFEYVLLDGINDTPEDLRRLPRLLEGIPCKVNLIPFNEHPALPFRRPPVERIEAFHAALVAARLTATLRWSKGPEIEAACGQLAGGRLGFEGAEAAAPPPETPPGHCRENEE